MDKCNRVVLLCQEQLTTPCGVSSVKSLIKPNPHVTELIIDIVFIRVKENPLNQKADLTIKTPNLLNCNT